MNTLDYEKGLRKLLKRAVMNLVDAEGDGWVMLSLLQDNWPKGTKVIAAELKALSWSTGYSYRSVTRGLKNLVDKGLAIRIRQGYYRPVLAPVLREVMRLEERGY